MATDPELAFMGVLDEHLSEFGPMARAQAARALSAAMLAAIESDLDPAAIGRGLSWALARAESAEKVAKEQAAKRRTKDDDIAAPPPAVNGLNTGENGDSATPTACELANAGTAG